MKWKNIIDNWKNGIILKYPNNINKRFFYETSVCDKYLENNYEEIFIENDSLNNLDENIYPFTEYINISKNKYATSFYNLSKDSKLVIPIPRNNKNFTTIKDFIDNASINHQKHFWKRVAKEINNMLKKYDKVYVNTHGLGVSYFHLRIDSYPKYYLTKKFIK